MRRFSVVTVVALAALLTLVSLGGCIDESKYNAVLLRNREQEKLLQEKEAQLATLQERVNALQARAVEAQQRLQEKDDHLASIMKERDEVRKTFEELKKVYLELAGRMAPVPGGTGIPAKVAIEIRQLAEQYPGLFEFDEATGRLRFASDITFDSGSNVVKPDARTALAKLGGILAGPEATAIRAAIVGHTDTDPVKKPTTIALLKELGKAASNQGLSEARAEAVAQVLAGGGVAASRISTRGVGETQPMADNRTAAGKAQNRRVEIFLSMGS
jgi:flagellar motor protein MotB